MPSWLIVGASRGLGYQWLVHLASSPSNIVIGTVRDKPTVEARLAKDGITNVHLLVADVTQHQAIKVAADDVAKITGGKGLDYLIHNAAVAPKGSAYLTLLDDTPQDLEDDLLAAFKANVVGPAHTVNAFLPLVRQGKEKKVVVVSTGMADADLITNYELGIAAPYSISKAGTNTLVAKYHAAVGKKEGILFLALSPGFVDTREGKPFSEAEQEGMKALGEKFGRYAAETAPNFRGPITPKESVDAQVSVIEKATVEEFGGAFISHHGNKNWL